MRKEALKWDVLRGGMCSEFVDYFHPEDGGDTFL
jgi:hypothetical protein